MGATTPVLEDVLTLARQLTPTDQAKLVEQLAPTIDSADTAQDSIATFNGLKLSPVPRNLRLIQIQHWHVHCVLSVMTPERLPMLTLNDCARNDCQNGMVYECSD